jgi:hypothetical protein
MQSRTDIRSVEISDSLVDALSALKVAQRGPESFLVRVREDIVISRCSFSPPNVAVSTKNHLELTPTAC